MFELPEVEAFRRDIISVEGLKVVFNKCFDSSIFNTKFYSLDGLSIREVQRFGLHIIIKFENNIGLLIKPRKTGKLYLESGEEIIGNTCLWLIQLNNRQQLRYIDTNSSSNISYMSYDDCLNYVLTKFGPEPFDISGESFILRIRQGIYANKPIKHVLMEQKLISGVGNIYASEICHEAFIHPETLVKDFTDKQLLNIFICTRRILNKAIEMNGINTLNFKGKAIRNTFLKIYKQNECQRCNIKINKKTILKKSTFFCIGCQRLLGGLK